MRNLEKKELYGRYSLGEGRHFSADTRRVFESHPLHWHRFFELEIILSGKGVCRVNDRAYDLSEYRLFFLTPTDFHEFEPNGEVTLINLSFDEVMIDEHEKTVARLFACERAYKMSEEEHARFSSAASLLLHENAHGGESNRRLLGYILASMLRKNERLPVAEPSLKSAHIGCVLQAYAYMQTHFCEKITLEELSSRAGYHPAYFSELFRRVTGENFAATLTRFRVGYARTRLSSGASVSDACFDAGFGSLSAFFAAFKKQCGCAPSAYQKQSERQEDGSLNADQQRTRI